MAFSESSASKLMTPERIRRPRLGVVVGLVESGMVERDLPCKVRGMGRDRRNGSERGGRSGKTSENEKAQMGDFDCQIGPFHFCEREWGNNRIHIPVC